ncbi:MAG: hypothetical protein HQM12_13215 [SAR324 cluster bacterium]|nr:hypothetical protein [SAR324 cluster bacterium]MBF0352896.1 hypothetical protein [SAR324 cluster bacterium]
MAETKVLESEFSIRTYILAFISYLGIFCLIPILLNKDDEYVHFHARQGVVLWLWTVIAIFALYIPVLGQFFFGLSAFLVLIFSFAGMFSVLLARAWKLPFVGDWAEGI